MAAHVWTSGESITASKLNKLEKKKAFAEGKLPLTSLTWNEAAEFIEDFGMSKFSIYNPTLEVNPESDIYMILTYYGNEFNEMAYIANNPNDLLVLNTSDQGGASY